MMASTAAVLNILVTANTKQATAALAKTQAQLGATAATANKSATGMGATMAKGAKVGGLAVAALGAMSIKAAADWEDAFAGVRKTVNASDKEFAKMEQGLRGLAKTMPITATEVADLAAEAGALGIKSKDIVKFTKVAAMLGEATDMSANDAANGLARLSNVMGTSSKDFERLGSTLVALGNKGASTEAEILSMAQRMAGAAKIIGLTEAEVLSMSSALASVGIRAEMGGSAISRVWLQIDDAIAKGSSQLESFARIAGMSEANFRRLFAEDANAAVIRYAAGLKTAHDQGESVSQMLKEVDLNEIRVRETLLKSSAAQKLLTQAQEQGNRAWEKNNALNQEAQTRFKTVASQASILKNRITDLFISLGQKLEPATRAVLETLNRLASGKLPKWFQDIIDKSAPLRAAISAIGGMFEKVFGGIEDILSGMVKAVKGAFNVLAGILTGDWARAWRGIKDVVRGVVEGVIGIVRSITAPVRAVAETLLNVFRGAFGAIKGAAKAMLDGALGAVTMVLDGVAKGADLMSKLPGPIGDAWDKIQTAAEDASNSINHLRERIRGTSPVVDKARQDWVTGWRAIAQAAAEKSGDTWRVWRDALNRTAATGKTKGDALADALNRAYREASQGADKHGGDAFKYWRNWLGKTNDEARDKGGKFASILGGSYENASKASRQGLAHLAKETNKALKSLGEGKSQVYVADTSSGGNANEQMAQKGAIISVPGTGTGDKVPAMLEPGEVVVNRRAVAAMGGPHRVNRINKMIPRFAEGGLVQALGPYDIPPIQYDANHAGGNSHLHLSMSSVSAAKALAAKIRPMGWEASESPWAGGVTVQHSDPGHYSGSAFDANTAADETRPEVEAVARILRGGVGGAVGAAAVRIAEVMLKGPDGPLKSMGQAVLSRVHKASNAMIARLTPAVTGGVSTISADGDVEKVFAEVAKRVSTSKAATMALGMAGYHESGMRDLSYGDSTSQGALQLLSSTAAGLGISPHDEGAIASHFLLRGYWGRGGANQLAAQGLAPHVIAHLVQGNATGTSVYAAERDRATAWMQRYGLREGGIVAKLAGGGTISIGSATGTATFGTATSVPPPGEAGYGYTLIPPEYEATMQRFRDQYAQYMEYIEGAEQAFALPESAFGTDLSEGERLWMLALSQERFNVGQSLLDHLKYAQSWGGYDSDTMAEFYSQITDLQGITGSGGSLAADKQRIAEYQQASAETLAVAAYLKNLITQRAIIEEQIELKEVQFGKASSQWGEALSPDERDILLERYQALLSTLQKTWYSLMSEVGRLTGLPGTQDTITTIEEDIRELVGWTGLGGSIGDTKIKIADLTGMDFTEPLKEQTIEQLRKLLLEANQRLAISQAQLPVFMGTFAKGGVALVGERGPELAHLPNGTRIHSADDTRSMLAPEIRVIIEDNRTRVFVDGREEKAIVQRGSRGYGRRPMPGAVGR
jgi:TP901 family phage tail tape measure protein